MRRKKPTPKHLICKKCREPIVCEISEQSPPEMRYHVRCRPWPPYSTRAAEREQRFQDMLARKRREREEEQTC